jgi:hypothetical protein
MNQRQTEEQQANKRENDLKQAYADNAWKGLLVSKCMDYLENIKVARENLELDKNRGYFLGNSEEFDEKLKQLNDLDAHLNSSIDKLLSLKKNTYDDNMHEMIGFHPAKKVLAQHEKEHENRIEDFSRRELLVNQFMDLQKDVNIAKEHLEKDQRIGCFKGRSPEFYKKLRELKELNIQLSLSIETFKKGEISDKVEEMIASARGTIHQFDSEHDERMFNLLEQKIAEVEKEVQKQKKVSAQGITDEKSIHAPEASSPTSSPSSSPVLASKKGIFGMNDLNKLNRLPKINRNKREQDQIQDKPDEPSKRGPGEK